jgi:ABC-type antimicrobial peptide transport system permease subunit
MHACAPLSKRRTACSDDSNNEITTAKSHENDLFASQYGDILARSKLLRVLEWSPLELELAVRTEAQPGPMIGVLRRVIRDANPHLAIEEFSTMQDAVEDSIGAQRLAAGVIAVFGGLALLITVVGLYGLLSYLVEQRKQEIGKRMALGADRGAVVGLVMRQTLVLMATGVAIGLGLALWTSRLLGGFLYGVTASDPWTMVLAPFGLVICGLLAPAIPRFIRSKDRAQMQRRNHVHHKTRQMTFRKPIVQRRRD